MCFRACVLALVSPFLMACVSLRLRLFVYVYACVRVFVRACVFVRVCVCAPMCVYVYA